MNRILFALLALILLLPVVGCSGTPESGDEASTAPVEATMVYYRMPG